MLIRNENLAFKPLIPLSGAAFPGSTIRQELNCPKLSASVRTALLNVVPQARYGALLNILSCRASAVPLSHMTHCNLSRSRVRFMNHAGSLIACT